MILKVDDVANKHKAKPAICVGHGSSLNDYCDRLKELKNKHLIFGSNNWFDYYDTSPNYWVVCGALENNLKNQYDRLNQIKTTTFCHSYTYDSNDYSNYNFQDFDLLLYNSYPNNDVINESIKNRLKLYTNSSERYGIGCNTGLHVITLSILMGCNPIYLIGFDVDHGLGFAKNSMGFNVDFLKTKDDPKVLQSAYVENYLSDLKTINNSAKNIGVEIINLNKNAFFDVFKIGEIE